MNTGYYKVIVKIEIDNGTTKDGLPKFKHTQEVYLVLAGSPEVAVKKVNDEMNACAESWKIDTVKEVKITSIIS